MYKLKKVQAKNTHGYIFEVQLLDGEAGTGVEIHPGSNHPAGGIYADFLGEGAAPQMLRDIATFFVDRYGSSFNFENADHYEGRQAKS